MNKRILVMADTHGDIGAVKRALTQAGDVDYVFHLGDGALEASRLCNLTDAKVYCVKGNCDFIGEKEHVVAIDGKRFWLVHGDAYGVKYSLTRIKFAAMEKNVDAVLFGHTHHSMMCYEEGLLMMNPGSLSHPKGCAKSFAVILLSGPLILPKIVKLALTSGV